MSAKFKVIPRKNLQNNELPPKYYPIVKSIGRISLRELSKKIARNSTVSRADVIAVIESFIDSIPEELSAGNIVDLGALGSFSLKINCEGSDSPEEVTSANIKKQAIRFNPSGELKGLVNEIQFEKFPT